MFCPVCKAEYRSGFTSCSDCGIALVEVAPRTEERFAAIRSTAPTEYDTLLTRGKDPQFYLHLLALLSSRRIPCFGKAANPVISDSTNFSSNTVPEFEIWIPKQQSRLATWVRDSYQEDYAASEELDLEEEQGKLETEDTCDPKKLCALCSAEYTSESTLCENCGTTLFWSNERVARGELARVLFSEAQPQMLGALRMALMEQNIPFNNALLYRNGLLRGNSSASSQELLVRDTDFDRSTEVLAHLLEPYEFEPTCSLRRFVDPMDLYWPDQAERNLWLPEDLVDLAWEGQNFFRFGGAASALREHRIPYRSEATDPKAAKLFVHPEDGRRARQIIEEFLDGAAPD
jgi:hypothetical protein